MLATISGSNFSQPLSRTDAIYFTVTVFATVGFGDITAKTEAARLVVTGQMITDLIAIGLGGPGHRRRGHARAPAPVCRRRHRTPGPVGRCPTQEDDPRVNSSGLIAGTAGLFTVTNIDDIVVLSLFFAQGAGGISSCAGMRRWRRWNRRAW